MKTNVVKMREASENQDLQRIVSMIEESSALAHKADYKFLAYLINMARIEAQALSNKRRNT